MAHETCASDAESVHERQQDHLTAAIAVITTRVGTAETRTRQIKGNDPQAGFKQPGPVIPGLKAAAKTMQEDHHGCIAWSGVPDMKPYPANLDEVVRTPGVARLEVSPFEIRGPEPGGSDHYQQGQQGNHGLSQHETGNIRGNQADYRLRRRSARSVKYVLKLRCLRSITDRNDRGHRDGHDDCT